MSSTGTSSSSLPKRNGMPKGRDVISSSHRVEREKKDESRREKTSKRRRKICSGIQKRLIKISFSHDLSNEFLPKTSFREGWKRSKWTEDFTAFSHAKLFNQEKKISKRCARKKFKIL